MIGAENIPGCRVRAYMTITRTQRAPPSKHTEADMGKPKASKSRRSKRTARHDADEAPTSMVTRCAELQTVYDNLADAGEDVTSARMERLERRITALNSKIADLGSPKPPTAPPA